MLTALPCLQLRETKPQNETLLEMKTEHTLRMLKLLQMLQVQAKRLQKLSAKANDPEAGPVKHKKLDPEKEVSTGRMASAASAASTASVASVASMASTTSVAIMASLAMASVASKASEPVP